MLKSLLARTSLTLALAVIGILLCFALVTLQYFILPVARQAADDQAALMVLAAETWVELPPYSRSYYQLELAEQHLLLLTRSQPDTAPLQHSTLFLNMLGQSLAQRLQTPVRLARDKSDARLIWATFNLPTGDIYIGFAQERRAVLPPAMALLLLGFASLLILLASVTVVSRITRPMVAAARAARRIGKGLHFEPLDESGPEELAIVARSFNRMGKEVRELLEHRTTLLAGISHDLRTPIARMRMAIELLDDGSNPELCERLTRNLGDMDRLIGDTLMLARGFEPQQAETLDTLVLLEELQDIHPERIELGDTSSLPEQLQLPWLAFKRVASNLIENALRYSGEALVRVELSMRGPELMLRIIDRGPGIPDEAKERIFEPFYRLESSRNQHTGGSGLGLAIVRQLCQLYDWHLAVQDNPAGGTIMQLTLLPEAQECPYQLPPP
ncbi:sensor histidine kinase [Balneatrix alpica]|uniref:histidine kinase n=1 Tax=Balneatrix alpica TaxID=75684 RepID=A0ABV5ZEW2_9GAMM|nr:HAMP domain-containing sensor histidine kinase [Balneatrix alpica]